MLRPLLLALVCAGMAFACRDSLPQAGSATILTIAAAIPKNGADRTGTATLLRLLTLEAPVAAGWDGRPAGRAFVDWQWLPGNLGLRLRVANGIRFHDGTLLTNTLAADILRKTFMPPTVMTLSKSVTSITPDGADAVVIQTQQPEGFLLSDLSTLDFSLPGNRTIGTGPYRHDSEGPPIVLQAFEGYKSGRPKIDTIKIVEYDTQRAAWAAMMRADANMLHDVSRDAIEFVEAETSIQTHSFERGYYDVLGFNQRNPMLARRDVRQALSEAVDRQQIIDLALKKRGSLAKGPFWPYHWALPANAPSYRFDAEAAQRRLDAAGLTVHPSDVPGQMPSRFRFNCLVTETDQRLQRVALVLQRQLYDVGIDLDVQPLPFGVFLQRAMRGDFDSLLTELGSYRSSAFVYSMWHSSLEPLGPVWNYHAADTALDQFRRAILDDEVRAAIVNVQQVMYDDPPGVFIDWTQRARAVSRDFQVPVERGRDILGTIQQWRPIPPAMQARR